MGHRAAPSVTRCPRQETGPHDVIVGIVDAERFGLNSVGAPRCSTIGDVVKHRLDDLELEANILRDAYIAHH